MLPGSSQNGGGINTVCIETAIASDLTHLGSTMEGARPPDAGVDSYDDPEKISVFACEGSAGNCCSILPDHEPVQMPVQPH